ncbi:MAG: mechanosensitive ion channel [Flavobacteriaceae bacterium]|nr:MAG: mechanosensitive ion channel [Flavobacteriaceae bacterium]
MCRTPQDASKYLRPVPVNKIIFLIFFIGVVLGPLHHTYSQDAKETSNTKQETEEQVIPIPEISEIIPLATDIQVRLLRTQKILSDTISNDALVSSLKSINEELDTLQISLNELKALGTPSFNSIKTFNLELLAVVKNFKDTNVPLIEEIAKVEGQRKMWLKEQENWSIWEDSLVTKNTPQQIKTTFNKSKAAIDTALKSLVVKLDQLLILQENSYNIQPKIEILQDEFKSFSQQNKELVIMDQSEAMFSSEFRDKFNPELWKNTKNGFLELTLTNKFHRSAYFWSILLGIFLFVMVYWLMKKNNEAILNNPEYKFLANKALVSAIFFSVTTTIILFKYDSLQPAEELLISLIIGASFCYILKDKLSLWKKQILYLLVLLVILDNLFVAINLPTPLIRLYIALVSLAIIILCLILLKKSRKENISKFWTFLLFMGALYFGIVFLSEIIGKEILALYLFDSFIRTAIQITLYAVFLSIFQGALKWLLLNFNSKQKYLTSENISSSVTRLTWFITFLLIVYLILPQLLVTWGVYNNLQESNDNFMALGFNVGDTKVTFQLIITAICVLYGSYIASSLFSRFMMNETINKWSLDKGTRLSIAQLVHYLIMFLGFLVAISVLGFDLTNFTIILSALSVGIGFGLQGLVNNFVSGLILLFERPIREGDIIESQGVPWSTVKEIGLRSTRLMTYEQSDLVVPNSELVYKNVTNWTLSNTQRKLILPVGVAYGSDISLVINTLMEIGKSHDSLLKSSIPFVLFRGFGESTLNFELWVVTKYVERGLSIKSEIYQEIHNRFEKENIKIAYPQLDVHLYKTDQ